MLNVEEQTARVERIYRQLTGSEPKHQAASGEAPIAPIPPDANPEQHVAENLQRLDTLIGRAGIPAASVAANGAIPAGPATMAMPVFQPRVSLFESDKEWRCAVELPGVRRDDLAVEIRNGVLSLSATRTMPGLEANGARALYAESPACRFERALPLPPFLESRTAEARLENGVLTIRAQKDPSAVRRELKVEVA